MLDPATALNSVTLTVHDLERELAFYVDVLGLRVHRREGARAALGAGGADLLRLEQRPEAPRAGGAAGMYHFCLLARERVDFARWLQRIAETRTPVEGLVDHRFSEAIYLPDPEGNTVELNWDRPREEWPDPERALHMGNGPLDTEGLFALLEGQPAAWTGAAPDTACSHIHLYVGDLVAAERFYVGVVGFERVMGIPGQAVFVSAGGYHHHVAFNVWKGRGIPAQPEGAAGLDHFTVRLAGEAELEALLGRVREAGVGAEETAAAWLVRDPAGIGVRFTAGQGSGAAVAPDSGSAPGRGEG